MCDNCMDMLIDDIGLVEQERDEWKARWQATVDDAQRLRDTLNAVRVAADWWVNTPGRPHADGSLLGREILSLLGDL